MKNNAPRISVFTVPRPVSLLLLGVIVPHAQVIADVPPPPPAQHQNAGFPSAQKLEQMGYNRETGVWKIQTNPTGKPTVSSGGGQITGTQGQRVTVTDGYGNKATVNTQVTQRVNSGRVEAAIGGTLAGLSAAGGAIGSDFAASAYQSAKNGDWGGFARDAFGAVLEGLSKLDFTGLGGGINQFLDKTGIREGTSAGQLKQAAAKAAAAQAQAERAGDFRAAVANAAAAKAATAAATAEQQAQQSTPKAQPGKYQIIARWFETAVKVDKKTGRETLVSNTTWTNVYADTPIGADNGYWRTYQFDKGGYPQFTFYWTSSAIKPDTLVSKIGLKFSDWGTYKNQELQVFTYQGEYIEGVAPNVNKPNVNPEDFMLNQQEVAGILNRMLEDQNTNHAELMKQLAKIGNVVPDSTTSTEFTPATATTAPYTPSGSNTPQQTQITINKDGSVTTSVIPRSDLVPNSLQAPTRSALIPNNPSTPTTPTSPSSPTPPTTPTSPNNPSTPITPDNQTVPNKPKEDQPPQENTAYEDPDIPTQTVDLDFKPADIFSVDGVCPEPRTVDFGMFGQHEFSYQPLCDFASRIRPILILITIVSCSFFVYSSLKD